MPDTGNTRKRHLDEASDLKARKKLRLPIDEGPMLTSEPVKVIVGISETTYFVDEAHLRASSDFFNKVLDGDWKESATRTVTLSKNMPWDFSIYAKWLYSGCLYMTEPDDRTYDKNLDMTIDKEYNKLNECYELADFLQAIDFKDACVDWIIDKMVAYNEYAFYIAGIIYAHSLKSSPHRQFTIDCALNFWQKGSFELILDKEFPQDFHKDLIHALGLPIRNGFKTVPVKTYFKNIDMCKYHEHTKNNKPCYKTMIIQIERTYGDQKDTSIRVGRPG